MENCTTPFECLLKRGYFNLEDLLVYRFVCKEFNRIIINNTTGPCRLIYNEFRTKTKIQLIPQLIGEERHCDCHAGALHIMRRKPKKVVTQEGITDDIYCHYFKCKYESCGNVLSANPNLFKDDINDIFIVCWECRKKTFSNPSGFQKSPQIELSKKPKLKKSMSRSWSGFSISLKETYDDLKDPWEEVLKKGEEKSRNRSSFNMKDMRKSFRRSMDFGKSLEDFFVH